MSPSGQRILKFSLEQFLKVKYLENVKDISIRENTIVLNVDDTAINIAGKLLKPWHSSIYSNITISSAIRIVCITLQSDFFSCDPFSYASEIKNKWPRVYDITPLPHFKDTELWRSDKEKVDDIEFNLWFASAGTNCGIHNEHNFRELHTQIYGIGRMQEFHKNKIDSLYRSVFMSPGYTHEPFYDKTCVYPWHQYYADTDCIWLAAEF
jgi:hypothetical protein